MLTLLKIDSKDLLPAPAAAKASIRVGQWAIALGRTYEAPLPSVSIGIVSALNRIRGRAIQTDVKVSPVNYGGPLVDISGKVIGVLVPLSPLSRAGGGTEATAGVEWYDSGIGFAIPAEDVYAVLDRLKTGKDLYPGLMGITFKRGRPLPARPVIDRVRTASPADKSGLKPGDVIRKIDGKSVNCQAQAQHALGSKYAGDTIFVTVTRDKQTLRKELTLVAKLLPYESAFLGILPIREDAQGVRAAGVGVRYVYPGSPADQIGLRTRDRVVRFGDHEINEAASLTDLVSRLRPGEMAQLVYMRKDAEKSVEVKLVSMPNTVPSELRSVAIPTPEKQPELTGKKPQPDNRELPEPESTANHSPQTGRFTVEMPNHQHSYWAYVPKNYNPRYEYGLMVWLHPAGDTMEAAVIKQWKSICGRRGLMIVAPKAEKLAGWNPSEAGFVKDAVEQFTARYAVDSKRIFLHGYSDGGEFALQLVFKYRELFRGAVTAAAALKFRPPENKPDFRLQLHLVCGDKDRQYPLVQATHARLRRMKYPVSLTILKNRDRKYPPMDRLQEIGRWADCLDRI